MLEKVVAQDSFARGMFQGVSRHLIPSDGAYDLLNFLLDDEDGTPYRRGGSAYLSSASPSSGTYGAASRGALGVWDGSLVGGDRTVEVVGMSSGGTDYALVAVGAADDTSLSLPIWTGGIEAVWAGSYPRFSSHEGLVAISDAVGAGSIFLYAGSRKSGTYTTGTVTATAGDTALTGAGTAWLANVDAGMLLSIGSRLNVVVSVESDTALTLLWPHEGSTGAGQAYTAWSIFAQTSARNAEFVARRLCVASSVYPNRMYQTGFGDNGSPLYYQLTGGDYHGFPGRVLGIHALRDTALVFTTAGLFAVRSMSLDLTDDFGHQQQTTEKLDGIVLWSSQGVQAWGNGLIVPARDGVYLVDGVSRPVLLSRSISELYRGYVASGYRPGQAFMFRETYVLPILDSSVAVQGWVACKLDGGDGEFWPWTRLSAGGMRCATARNRADSLPKLLGGSSASGAKLSLLSWFDPSSSVKNDADGNAFTFTLETRDFPTGNGQLNHVTRARVGYTLVDAATDNPAFTFSYAGEDGSYTAHSDTAAESAEGSETWLFAKRSRYVRLKLSCATAAATASIKSIEGWVRPSRRD